MSSSSFPINAEVGLIVDTSVVINLNATGCAAEILRAFPHAFLITDIAYEELARGERNGHRDSIELQKLFDQAVIEQATLGQEGKRIFSSLVEGSARTTLDDGEAATIACAIETGRATVIDERKARKICRDRFPELGVVSTADILTDIAARDALGTEGQIDAIVAALQGARMRIPSSLEEKTVKIIGTERAFGCHSLPKAIRVVAQ